ncbi:aminotransferase class I/II-fold pyridoxal phosphate-dependent enzyme [Neobacillus pocheonensis]|uniref:Aminotransferase class I/II-fold pyridoxal phosphate-dependent enzyme n=1 Tax=Neobacillus pocheonensis TaxID=363869 RepID=A0ABT0WEQ0_9BACI|nr:aminotransferase class I/II-fold pyridoxal phosphate-dependent enzyme [Neobacillus pocheonensis]
MDCLAFWRSHLNILSGTLAGCLCTCSCQRRRAGAISNVVWNYSNVGDTILTHDWYWTPYSTICKETGRYLETFDLLYEEMKFNLNSFSSKVKNLLAKQDYLVIILNSPNHNPTGYSISDSEWDEIIDLIVEEAKDLTKTITLVIDIAYIDYTKDPVSARSFMEKFGTLPSNIVIELARKTTWACPVDVRASLKGIL